MKFPQLTSSIGLQCVVVDFIRSQFAKRVGMTESLKTLASMPLKPTTEKQDGALALVIGDPDDPKGPTECLPGA